MPIFEYECAKCKKIFEVLVSSDDSATIRCPACSSRKITKLFSSFRVGSTGSGGHNSSRTSSACTTCTSNDCSTCG